MTIRNQSLPILLLTILAACGRPGIGVSTGGELTGVPVGKVWHEPTPYNMVLVKRGAYRMGPGEIDSLWGITVPTRGVSVDDFWMDEAEITNAQYKQFVFWVRDSIIRERLADPAYAGDERYKITEDEYGDPIPPRLNWSIPIPWTRNTEEEEAAINSVYVTHPITGKKMLDARQMNFRYEWFDATEAAKRHKRLNPEERILNTDIPPDPDEVIMITKDTAYIDETGRIVNETITRPLSSLYDFVHTRIVNIYPDTTCWVNDFENANNEYYLHNYFSHPAFAHHPVVGVTWEAATAFCEWRTMFLRRSLQRQEVTIEKYRLPTEAEWEMAARSGKTENRYPWGSDDLQDDKACYLANFKPGEGAYAADRNLIPAKTRSYPPNDFGLYDMAGNVAEWTSTAYTESGNRLMSDMNPEYRYDAAVEDPYLLKRKVVKGGSWKDISTFIRSDMRDSEFQNRGRSYIGFRCVRTPSGVRK
ncbi:MULTISPECIES: SUMF1/EgtB/PvdO family nonheme iron enzyme [Petrimonas]|jgi:sulfatase modifying factor 1|uniref:Sulfatase-modifying factor 2 n=1 Tax=Petrimonas mucosa TaxID=1642646 RepID=A0A1G4GA88_9BACT|nr:MULTISPECIES: SUMF1/EgtB/PvdO family nonheme iron enzyme [Petrimonas]MDD3560333.1 SUMF1/EgtB/PvdO family nonheme iron enzyme [Petrimonas mucosa]SCM59452.1 Sulfatase-modifying factor 2 [Petrimonas mucosa]SFU34485.1 gliding motility-associated lipoprotein GldK [Porphyromonadaceae bacterium KHP3R9]HHT30595.1 SUMF1/EgtB/PvdO family nonheme iron enzyme [Petrimonas mucosa]